MGGLAFIPVFLSNVEGVGFLTPGTDSHRAAQLVQQRSGIGERAPLVVSSKRLTASDPAFTASVRKVVSVAKRTDKVLDAIPPSARAISRDGHTAVVTVLLRGSEGERQLAARELQRRIDDVVAPGVSADLTGPSALFSDLIRVEERDLVKAEAVGIPIAGLILVLAFGTMVAAGLPILVAIAGLIATFGLLGVASTFTHFSAFIENVIVMIGLGVGIDYALLIVRRFREEREHRDDVDAIAWTMATAGRTVIFSGATVVMTLVPLALAGLPFFTEIAGGAALVVTLMVTAALTLVPASLVAFGDRIERLRVPRPRLSRRGGGWERWAHFVMRRPWAVLAVALVALGAMAAPALQMKTGIDLGLRAYASEPSATGLTTLERAFPSGALSPVEVVVTSPRAAGIAGATQTAERTMRADRRLAAVTSLPLGPGAVLVSAAPLVPADAPEANDLVLDLRRRFAASLPGDAQALVGGTSAESGDFAHALRAAAPMVVAAALGLCFLVLLLVFRSPFLALKAVLANLLSIAASFGLVVLVFQEGFGEDVLGFTSPGYLQAYIPLTLFVLVYGLSMDYEVFIVSRMREEWERNGGDTQAAIATGLERTGGVVTSAAAIMVAVFSAFMLTRVPEIKQFGFGLAAAIAIDATIVRAALVPAVMRIAGRWNWWQPRWLERLLDRVPLAPEASS